MFCYEFRLSTYVAVQKSEAAFFKVSFLNLVPPVILGDHLVQGVLDHVLDLTVGVSLGTLACM